MVHLTVVKENVNKKKKYSCFLFTHKIENSNEIGNTEENTGRSKIRQKKKMEQRIIPWRPWDLDRFTF